MHKFDDLLLAKSTLEELLGLSKFEYQTENIQSSRDLNLDSDLILVLEEGDEVFEALDAVPGILNDIEQMSFAIDPNAI